MSLMTELIIRAILVISITDSMVFYIIDKYNPGVISLALAFAIIIVTIIPMVIGIWFSFYKRKEK